MAIKRLGAIEIITERQLSGGDAAAVTRYVAHVLDEGGNLRDLTFDHSPTDDEIAAQMPQLQDVTPTTSKAALLPIAKERVFEASQFDWFNTKAQADAALTAAQKTAVANLNTQLYQRARAAVGAWYAAT